MSPGPSVGLRRLSASRSRFVSHYWPRNRLANGPQPKYLTTCRPIGCERPTCLIDHWERSLLGGVRNAAS